MSWALSRITQGLATQSTAYPYPPNALSVTGWLPSKGLPSASIVGYSNTSLANYDDNLGVLTLEQLVDGSGIKVSVTADFPDDYQGMFAILRGQFEYKRNTTKPNAIAVYTQVAVTPYDAEYTDTDVTPGVHYYYTIVALVGSSTEPIHFEYNPITGFATAYRYDSYGHTNFMLNQLPLAWRENATFLDGFIDIFGTLLDGLKTDIEAYLLNSNSTKNIPAQHLKYLAEMLDWEIDNEIDELKQREAIENATSVYRKKGRDQALEYIIQLITGWDVEFEQGYRRVFKLNDEDSTLLDPDESYQVVHIGYPERVEEDESLGTSTGLASQFYWLGRERVRDVIVEVYNSADALYDTWQEVTTFVGQAADAEVYVLTEVGYATKVTFGDGVNGAIPTNGAPIQATYHFNGDTLKYLPAGLDGWRGETGIRLLLTPTISSEPFTSSMIEKVVRLVERLKASYAIYTMIILSTEVENAYTASDSYTDVITPIHYFLMNTPTHVMNDPTYRMPS